VDLLQADQADCVPKQSITFPIDYNQDSRWLKTTADDTWQVGLPVFCEQEVYMQQGMAMGVMLLDDDSLPGLVLKLIDFVFKAAEAVASAFGEEWVSAPLDFLESFIDKMLMVNAVTDRIGTGSALVTRATGWGVSFGDDDTQWQDPEVLHCSNEDGSVWPTFRSKRVLIPPDPKHIRVTLDKIEITQDGDDWDAELWGKWRIWDGKSYELSGRFPDSGYLHKDDPITWDLGIGMYDRTDVGPFLYLEVAVWDADEPFIGDNHDNLGNCHWLLWPYDEGFASTNLVGYSRREGEIKVYVNVEEVP
jgi:hypothetical protein